MTERTPDEATPLDRMRDLLDGALPAADAESLRSEIAADPALGAELGRLRDVLAMTGVVADAPECAVTADDVLRRARPVRRLRPWMAAAAVLAATAIGVAASALVPRTQDVTLAALSAGPPFPAATAVPAAPASPFPAALADYRPVRDGKPNWLTSWDQARAWSRETGKPILLWIHHPTCPYCIELDRDTFTDAAVQSDLSRFVPVKLDVMEMDQDSEPGKRLGASKAWPYIAAIGADGGTIEEIPSAWTLSDVRPKLDAAAEKAGDQPTWERVREGASDLEQAIEAQRDGRFGASAAAARRARDTLPGSAVAERADALVRDADRRAQQALCDAASAADPRDALPALDDAARRFEGAPAGADLAAVAAAIRETGRFPRLHSRTETQR